jgi:hypothetical protein
MPTKGTAMSQEQKNKISDALKGRRPSFIPTNNGPRSPELRARISATLKAKGIKPPSRKGVRFENALIRVPGYKAFLEKRRNIRKKQNGGKFTFKEWQNLKEKYNFTCQKCLREEPEISITIDHIIPISKGGKDELDNIQPLCLYCNMVKKDKIQRWLWGEEVEDGLQTSPT